MENLQKQELQAKLKSYTEIIIADHSFYPQVMQAVQDLYGLILGTGGLDVNHTAAVGTCLKTGFALSPQEAGRCIFDLARTRIFARGIIGAIREKLPHKKDRPLQIFYAGCGPYAWLALLAIPFFTAADIQFTIVDIHQQSLDSAEKIIESFGIGKYFKKTIAADVLGLTEAEVGRPDVLIIEAMKSALQKEPQVSMALHLAPMLAERGIMLPENIRVTPAFTEINIRTALQRDEDTSVFKLPYMHAYGAIAELNIDTVSVAEKDIKKPFKETNILLHEDFLMPNYVFELRTEVVVWKDEIIKGFDSAVSLPVTIENAGKLAGKSSIRFFYLNNAVPGFRWEIT